MKRVIGNREESEGGAILVLFAMAMVVLVGITAIAVDGSFGFVQNRRAQNATDFAAFAASQQLSGYCEGTGNIPTMQEISSIVQGLVNDNSAGIGTDWSAQFLGENGQPIAPTTNSTFTSGSTSGYPPPGACGVSVTAAPVWAPFFAGIFGVHQLKGFASGSVSNTPRGTPISIVALNKVGPHEILGGGTGTFVVSGNIFLNSDVSNQPWTSSSDGWEWDDAIDAKADSNLYVYGTIDTNDGTYNGQSLWPLDHCFQPSPLGQLQPGETNPSAVSYAGGNPASNPPSYAGVCSQGSVTVDYDGIAPNYAQISDPLSGNGGPPDPISGSTAINCPGLPTYTYGAGAVSPSAGNQVLKPGDYTVPVTITGNATFEDCAAYGEAAYPGIYRFEDGLQIDPAAGDTVTGSNVVIATGSPYPMGGNTLNGTTSPGNGAPCLPAGTKASAVNGGQSEVTANVCGGTSPTEYGVVAYGDSSISQDASMSGTGDNFSLMIGGGSGSKVSLSGPTTGEYAGTDGSPGLVLYQDPGTQANYGFDAEAGDSAAVGITGVVYNASLANYGSTAPLDYWDGSGGGVPFYAGGTLQTGYGTGWTGPAAPAASSGSVTLTGTAIVDDFNTDGSTTIKILGEPYTLPGGGKLSLIG